MSDKTTIDNIHVVVYGHEMLDEVITRARKNNIPYDKEMYYDFHAHGHDHLVHQQGQLTLVEDPTPNHSKEGSLNDLFELYISREEVKDKFAELKEAHSNGAVIESIPKNWIGDWTKATNPIWDGENYEYRIKPEEDLKLGDKVIGIRTDCAIVGEVTSVSKKKFCVNNLAFLKDQVSPLTDVQYDDIRFLINGLKGHD
ncbi:hypothetical protein GQF61_16255 [Sphingobacterium sp. DK4209]|uniref:Uncharacterized protein n=1 Tax=Sphingobacterium zhuxiongii TaxID=2662364 RepID=A0A5Q0QCH7_9SPHI|nr:MULTISPECIES: hypothetical protein [unclassified Sphingobacterium]MVZ67408.1 hypothetical protein [Sphingobacterium sp. DK4209]QGA25398.1 hypothetical protein GFH32_03255 [Sphingobacterium sp. dk4302]